MFYAIGDGDQIGRGERQYLVFLCMPSRKSHKRTFWKGPQNRYQVLVTLAIGERRRGQGRGRQKARFEVGKALTAISLPVALALLSCYPSRDNIREGPMIHHLSIAARDPKHVAGVLAEFMGGKAVPFPPNPGSYFALQLDEHGSGVEVYPAGTELHPGDDNGGTFVKKPEARGYGPTHFALSVTTDAGTVEALAAREGWKCFRCNRGPFHVIEVWVENESMVEILPPEYAAEYLAFTRPDNITTAMAAAAPAASRVRPA
jgi:hypothetical protein